MSSIEFRFDGGIADNHELNFYEAGRFHYAAARMVYTIEKFRQTGVVSERLTSKVSADIRIRSSEHKCFLLNVYQFAAPVLAECVIKVPLEVAIAYCIDLLFPGKSASDKVHKEVDRVLQRERERDEAEYRRLKLVADMARDSNKTVREALTVAKAAQEAGLVQKMAPDVSADFLSAVREIRASVSRKEMIQDYKEEFEKVSAKSDDKIVQHLHRTLPEIALPLRSSANEFSISANDNGKDLDIGYFDEESISGISKLRKDDVPTSVRGTIKMYDKETGYGKFRYEELGRPISFRVPSEIKSRSKNKILDGMKKEDVLASFYFVRDARRNPVSLIFVNISEEN